MKSKKVLLLGTFALVLTSGLAAVGTTYAWYQTNRSASLMFGGAAIHNQDAELKLTFLGSQNGLTDKGINPNEFEFEAINRVTDISGDGIDFYKPFWSSKKDEAVEIKKVDAEDHFVDLFFKIERINQPEISDGWGLKVYLGEDTKFEPVDPVKDQDIKSLEALRFAVISYDNHLRANPEVEFVYAPHDESPATYLKRTGDSSDVTYTKEGYKLETQTLKTEAFKTADKQVDANYEIADLMAVNEAYIAFRVWIEGTDAEAVLVNGHHGTDGSLGGMFKFNLDIYGLTDDVWED